MPRFSLSHFPYAALKIFSSEAVQKEKAVCLQQTAFSWYARLDSNQWPTESESVTLSN